MGTIHKSFCAAQTLVNAADASDGDAAGAGGGCFCLGYQGFIGAQVEVYCDFSGTTDNLRVRVFGSLDGTSVDTVPLTGFDITNAAEARASFILEDLYWFRVDSSLTGTPTDKGVVTVRCVPWEITSA